MPIPRITAAHIDPRFDGSSCPMCDDTHDPRNVHVLWPDEVASRDVFSTYRMCIAPADGELREFIDADPREKYNDTVVMVAVEHTGSDELTPREGTDESEVIENREPELTAP